MIFRIVVNVQKRETVKYHSPAQVRAPGYPPSKNLSI
nr:MAG TPA: hypothetical protein [Bacteriophage sp.]